MEHSFDIFDDLVSTRSTIEPCTTIKNDPDLFGLSRVIYTVVWYVPDFACNCFKVIWREFPRISSSDDVRHEFNIVIVDSERALLLGLSLQPVRSLKNLFFVIFQAYVTRAKRKRNLVVAVICALDT